MGKDSALYQLMDVRMNGIMNGIVSDDGEYQQISRKSDEYFSEQNTHSTCAIDPGMGCPPTCLAFPTARRCFWGNACQRK